ncbi:GMP synthase (glutamine-hydrolyzing) [Putridiphycobacter roseus]|uniref:GMP synthase [glutamine-hydrolyzing] n=1 Tax=Putridiphycobacter roseus TaxID=2219161 RepID=A0A2W1MYV0_9FLAO|nr:glutamine-hydrolyzing GMP synthase [Putridiphycobacter roseus]PZE16410.1 GMP synthase (glutamine-hydrolyzing) [Putridiphycobacter roseus]
MKETILILDFGSQYTQLIARRLRELNVYCEIHPWDKAPDLDDAVKGVILSGSPFSVRDEKSPKPQVEKYKGKIPLLGVCFGAQYLAQNFGGEVLPSEIREYGRANLNFVSEDSLMKGVASNSQVWMSHGDTIAKLPANFEKICSTHDVEFAGFKIKDEATYGIQFHPEVYHSLDGQKLLENFIVGICKCSQDWTPDAFVESTVKALKEKLGNDKVIMGLSGGVDSSVAAFLLNKAIGTNLHCIFVDNGLLRKDEYATVLESYKGLGLNVKGVDAADRFYEALVGESDPEKKRKIIGGMFIEVFDEESHKVEGAKWLGQGTIYPDVIESVSATGGPSATIKSHHNVGGLPDFMKLKVVEPLRLLFKDEVRRVGRSLEIPEIIIGRHPFPGPGLGIRILGDITKEKVRILQEVDHIFISGLKKWDLYDKVWQAGVILLPVQSVGVMGDERTYEKAVALRAVESTDGMTADWVHLPYDFLAEISNKIINGVKGINRVTYDISSKPPATIEWE